MPCVIILTDCFQWMCIFSDHAKRCLEAMVYLVNVLVQSFVMHQTVYPEMPRVLDHSTNKYLHQQFTDLMLLVKYVMHLSAFY